MRYIKTFENFDENVDGVHVIDEGVRDILSKAVGYFKNNYFTKLFKRLGLSFKAGYKAFTSNKDFSNEGDWIKSLIYIAENTNAKKFITVIYGGKQYGADLEKVSSDVKKRLGNRSKVNEGLNEKLDVLYSADTQVPNVTPEELPGVLDMHRIHGDAPFIWGAPGIGKTQIVVSYAKETYEKDKPVIILNLALMAPEDFVGLPYVEDTDGAYEFEDGTTVNQKMSFFATPFFLPRPHGKNQKGNKGGLLFLDEYNRAPKKVLDASNSLILDGVMGTYRLPEDWVIVAAGNRPGGQDGIDKIVPLGADQGSRFSHYNLVTTVKSVVGHFSKDKTKMFNAKNFNKMADELRKNGYSEEQINAFGSKSQLDPEIQNWLETDSSQLYTLKDDDSSNKLFASPRSWINASVKYIFAKELAKAKGEKLTYDKLQRIIAGAIGNSAADKFLNQEALKYITNKDIEKLFKIDVMFYDNSGNVNENVFEDFKQEVKKAKITPVPETFIYAAERSIILDNVGAFMKILQNKLFLHKESGGKDWSRKIENIFKLVWYVQHHVFKVDRTLKKNGKHVPQTGQQIINLLRDLAKKDFRHILKSEYVFENDPEREGVAVVDLIIDPLNEYEGGALPKDKEGKTIFL